MKSMEKFSKEENQPIDLITLNPNETERNGMS